MRGAFTYTLYFCHNRKYFMLYRKTLLIVLEIFRTMLYKLYTNR
jgi:hypothetical protein